MRATLWFFSKKKLMRNFPYGQRETSNFPLLYESPFAVLLRRKERDPKSNFLLSPLASIDRSLGERARSGPPPLRATLWVNRGTPWSKEVGGASIDARPL
jgi:hypothetical protein